MKIINEFLYQKMLKMKPSQNCEYAGILYCEAIAKICPKRPAVAPSILRVAIRPIFYLGYSDPDEILLWLEYKLDNTKTIKDFLSWLKNEKTLLETCLEELKICCDFYDLKYSEVTNSVILKDDYGKKTEFKSFKEFRTFYENQFEHLNILTEEIERIIGEEGYIKEFDKIRKL